MALVAWFPFEDTTDAKIDYSGQGNNGTGSMDATDIIEPTDFSGNIALPLLDNYFNFNSGTNNYMDIPNMPDSTVDFTIAFWLHGQPADGIYIIDSGSAFDIRMSGTNVLFTIGSTSVSLSKTAQWDHFGVSWDVSEKRATIYRNFGMGNNYNQASSTIVGTTTAASTDFRIGATIGGTNYLTEPMDEIYIWDHIDPTATLPSGINLINKTSRQSFRKRTYFPFTTLDDESGYTQTTNMISITQEGGKIGLGGRFNGTSSYIVIDISDSPDTTRDFSFSFYVKFDNFDADMCLVDLGWDRGGFGIYYNSTSDRIIADLEDYLGVATELVILSTPEVNRWYLITVNWDWNVKELTAWVDRKKTNSIIFTSNFMWIVAQDNLNIGRNFSGGASDYFDGMMDEFRFNSFSLTQRDVEVIFFYRNRNYWENIWSWWKFHGNYLDCSSNEFDGVASGNTFFTTTDMRYGQGIDLDGTGDFVTISNYNMFHPARDWIGVSITVVLDALTTETLLDIGGAQRTSGTVLLRVISSSSIEATISTNRINHDTKISNIITWSSGFTLTTGTRYTFFFAINWAIPEISLYINSSLISTQALDFAVIPVNNILRDVRIGEGVFVLAGLNGRIENVRIYNDKLSLNQIQKDNNFWEYYDVWIGNQSLSGKLIDLDFINSINFQAGEFNMRIRDKLWEIFSKYPNGTDIKIYLEGRLIWIGAMERPERLRSRQLECSGRNYFNILFQRRHSADYTGNPKTRAAIMGDIITAELSSSQGNIYFDNTEVQTINTTIIEPILPRLTIAEIFLRFAQEEKAAVYTDIVATLPIPIIYIPKGFKGSGVTLDWNDRTKNTVGNKLRKYEFEFDAHPVKSKYSVYSPASTGEITTMIDVSADYTYGTREIAPIIDTDGITEAIRKERIFESRERWKKEIQTGTIWARDYYTLISGNTVALSIDDFDYDRQSFLIYQDHHFKNKREVKLKVVDLSLGYQEAMQAIIKIQNTIDFRDTDPNSIETIFYLFEFENEVKFSIKIVDGNGVIQQDTSEMITTRVAKDEIADLISGTGTSVKLDVTNGYLAYGTNTTALDESTTILGTEVGTRKLVDSAPSDIGSGLREYNFTMTNTQIPDTTVVTEWAIVNASTGGVLFAVQNSNPITKVATVDLNVIIRMEVV